MQAYREQARHWMQARGCGRWSDSLWEQAILESTRALDRLEGRDCREFLAQTGIRLQFTRTEYRVGPVRFRARLSLEDGWLTVYEASLAEVGQGLSRQGTPPERARDLVVAHETFHVLRPNCPGQACELAAHLFASRTLGLDFFAGLVDLEVVP